MNTHEARERVLFERAGACIKNWQFDCAGLIMGTYPLKDSERHMLQHQIVRQIHFSEYETARLLRMCLYACSVVLSMEKDCNQEKDELGEDYFHVKMLKDAIAAAKEGGFE